MAIATGVRVDLEQFNTDGYTVVDGVLTGDEIQAVVDEYLHLLDDLVDTWKAEGKLSDAYRDLPFAERFARVLGEVGPKGFNHFDISLPFSGITEETPIHLGPAVFGLMRAPGLLDAVEQVMGPEILSNPIQHVRIKPPQRWLGPEFIGSLMGQTDWHQDQGVALEEIDETNMLTVWMPIMDATVENGCLCVVPGSYTGGLVTHCSGVGKGRIGLHIPDELRGANAVPVPVPRGSALFLNRATQHASLTNESDGVRWSFDLRYQPTDQPTGRPWFPAWVARSRRAPETEVRDWQDWAARWRAARSHLTLNPPTGKFNRWTGDEPACA